ncbi:hypothetical protein Tco_1275980 [Tanacetum coccineum]
MSSSSTVTYTSVYTDSRHRDSVAPLRQFTVPKPVYTRRTFVPSDEDEEDPKEDPADNPADGGDDDNDESYDDDDDDDDVEEDEEEEEHLAPQVDFFANYLS